jgi:hypothetical protein
VTQICQIVLGNRHIIYSCCSCLLMIVMTMLSLIFYTATSQNNSPHVDMLLVFFNVACLGGKHATLKNTSSMSTCILQWGFLQIPWILHRHKEQIFEIKRHHIFITPKIVLTFCLVKAQVIFRHVKKYSFHKLWHPQVILKWHMF